MFIKQFLNKFKFFRKNPTYLPRYMLRYFKVHMTLDNLQANALLIVYIQIRVYSSTENW